MLWKLGFISKHIQKLQIVIVDHHFCKFVKLLFQINFLQTLQIVVLDNFSGQGHKHFTPSWFSGPRMAEEATLFNTLVMVARTSLWYISLVYGYWNIMMII